MKNVVIYNRVSTDEQAEKGYSLGAQEEKLIKYCTTKGINILNNFTEDYSAWKGFDRPAYKKLNAFLKANKGRVDGILFTQWSRFSRDIRESYIEIQRLRDMGIEANAIEQWIDISIPENQYVLAFYLAAPQVENDRLSDRTRVGMNHALKQGRWLWKAPYGYKNNKETKLIDVDLDAAAIVKESFELLESGLLSAEEVRRRMMVKGFAHSKQGFLTMLQNVLYVGKILIPAFKDEPAQVIKGLHEKIIDETTFDKVQFVLNGKKKSYKGITKCTETPLVGLLYCPLCDRPMTGSGSRGNGGIYHYYHCQRIYGCRNNISAKDANLEFSEYISGFQPEPEEVECYQIILEDEFKTNGSDRENEKEKLKFEINRLEESLHRAAVKNIDGVIDDFTYKNVKSQLEGKKNEMAVKLIGLNTLAPEFSTYIKNSKTLISNLSGFYQNSTSDIQKKIAGSIFTDKIYFENNTYRTTKLNEAIELIEAMGKGLNKNCLTKNVKQSSWAPPV